MAGSGYNEYGVKVASILKYFMLKQLAHFLLNLLADLLYKLKTDY